jgi:hypothetical protein
MLACRLSYGERASQAKNPLARQLLELMERKKSNLSVAADVDTAEEMLALADKVREAGAVFSIADSNSMFTDARCTLWHTGGSTVRRAPVDLLMHLNQTLPEAQIPGTHSMMTH